jgi:hypothetical protein
MHAAIKRHDSAGEGLLPAHGSPMRRSHHAVFALLLQDRFLAKPGRGGEIFREPDNAASDRLLGATHNCLRSVGEPSGCSLIYPWSLTA